MVMGHASGANLRRGVVLALAISLVVLGTAFFFALIWAIFGTTIGDSYIDGTAIDRDTHAPVPNAIVSVSNRWWGFEDGALVADHDYVTSTLSDDAGHFHVAYRIGSGAHLIATHDGYDRFDGYFDRNSTVTVELIRPVRRGG